MDTFVNDNYLVGCLSNAHLKAEIVCMSKAHYFALLHAFIVWSGQLLCRNKFISESITFKSIKLFSIQHLIDKAEQRDTILQK